MDDHKNEDGGTTTEDTERITETRTDGADGKASTAEGNEEADDTQAYIEELDSKATTSDDGVDWQARASKAESRLKALEQAYIALRRGEGGTSSTGKVGQSTGQAMDADAIIKATRRNFVSGLEL